MYLLNQIAARSKTKVPIVELEQKPLDRIAGLLTLSQSRYVLEEDLAEMCRLMVMQQPDLLVDCFDLIRLPTRVVWVEWTERLDSVAQRIGLIVRSTEEGRRGNIQAVWEMPDGAPKVEGARIAFDFDRPFNGPVECAFKHTSCELDELLSRFWLEPCEGKLVSPSIGRSWREIGARLWLTGPIIASFCVMLSFRNELEVRHSSYERLNKKRAKSGKPKLLDHVELRSSIFSKGSESSKSLSQLGGQKKECRLHHVRGHFARRGDTVFWRRPHLRGNASIGCTPRKTQIFHSKF